MYLLAGFYEEKSSYNDTIRKLAKNSKLKSLDFDYCFKPFELGKDFLKVMGVSVLLINPCMPFSKS